MTTTKTNAIVKFYVERNGDILAVFPNVVHHIGTYTTYQTCYSHIGQHSAISPAYYKNLKKATPDQYKDLKEELESIGYDLDIK